MSNEFHPIPYTFIYVWESKGHGIRKSLSPGAWNGMLPTKTIPVWTKPLYDSTVNQIDPFYSGFISGEQDWQVLKTAVDTWGEYEQVMMAIGECGEFLTLMGRKVQGRLIESDMHDEIADVLIMMHQMANIYGIDHVRARVRHKMKKLAAKLDKYKQEPEKKEDA